MPHTNKEKMAYALAASGLDYEDNPAPGEHFADLPEATVTAISIGLGEQPNNQVVFCYDEGGRTVGMVVRERT